ncbi:Peptidyl-tRNA hydrolase [Rubripirellula obstinata]|uniref:Peptidyl-tRNA hydrolase n=1 Tax=Rubripirellula obstinata TaxID=406547 RepID=A0A5B1CHR9_9BACT|nr:aminoacyl-tRNA hydrolase [Rubripirellula obstinata]KAA1259043.1 Peptidyl-tRNA hydrolase [Rubripirellula obstinata]
MKLIVGLGNPGKKYEQTRHNVGFDVVAKVAALTSASPSKTRFEGEFAEAMIGSEKVVMLWPQTYMNASGQSVRKAIDFFKLADQDLLVVCDDLDLPVGRLRFKKDGSAGGQKGIADTIRHLRSESFSRLKVGIGRPPAGWETADYVLGRFGNKEAETIETITTTAAKAVIDWVNLGVVEAMNHYNSVGKPPPKPKVKRPQPKQQQNPADDATDAPDPSESSAKRNKD